MELLIVVFCAALAFFATRGGRQPIYPGRGWTDLVTEGLGAVAKGVLENVVPADPQAPVAPKRSALAGDNRW